MNGPQHRKQGAIWSPDKRKTETISIRFMHIELRVFLLEDQTTSTYKIRTVTISCI